MKFNNYLDNFVNAIRQEIDSDNLVNMEKNITSLKVRKKLNVPNVFSNVKVSGSYDSKKNQINIYEFDSAIIYHELLHMASSMCINKASFEGFYCDYYGDEYILFGEGINEGYTELLARRIFNIDTSVCNGYEYLVYIATLLEEIVTEELMQRYYFTANMPGLIEELCNYNSKDNVLNFIDNCDYIIKSLDKTIIRFRKDNVFEKLVEINKFLATSFAKKMYGLYKNNEISRDDMIKKMFKFNCLLIDDEPEPDKYRVITSKEDICSYIEDSVDPLDKSIVSDYKLIRVKEG